MTVNIPAIFTGVYLLAAYAAYLDKNMLGIFAMLTVAVACGYLTYASLPPYRKVKG